MRIIKVTTKCKKEYPAIIFDEEKYRKKKGGYYHDYDLSGRWMKGNRFHTNPPEKTKIEKYPPEEEKQILASFIKWRMGK